MNGTIIQSASGEDLPNILKLQYLVYQSEAELLKDPCIPPLRETLENLERQYADGAIIRIMTDEQDTIIGSVRGSVREGSLFIGKLMVHPQFQGLGYGKQLLSSMELEVPDTVFRFELFTSNLSKRNISLYSSQGYKVFRQQESGNGKWMFVFMEKYR